MPPAEADDSDDAPFERKPIIKAKRRYPAAAETSEQPSATELKLASKEEASSFLKPPTSKQPHGGPLIKVSVPVPPNPTPEVGLNPDKTGKTGLKAAMAAENVKPKSLFGDDNI